MRSFAVICAVLCFAAIAVNAKQVMVSMKNIDEAPRPQHNLKLDMCPYCVNFMGDAMNQMINAIMNVGVAGTCGSVCSQLPEQLMQVGCTLICDYVGFTEFINLVDYEDPDPIYVCQDWDMCPVVNGGAVNITNAGVSPKSGPAGTKFNIFMDYQVLKPTGPGYILNTVIPPDAFPLGASQFTEGQPLGRYSVSWTLDSTPSENEPFDAGQYQVQVAVCAGDCTTNHAWGGVYALSNLYFGITNSTSYNDF